MASRILGAIQLALFCGLLWLFMTVEAERGRSYGLAPALLAAALTFCVTVGPIQFVDWVRRRRAGISDPRPWRERWPYRRLWLWLASGFTALYAVGFWWGGEGWMAITLVALFAGVFWATMVTEVWMGGRRGYEERASRRRRREREAAMTVPEDRRIEPYLSLPEHFLDSPREYGGSASSRQRRPQTLSRRSVPSPRGRTR